MGRLRCEADLQGRRRLPAQRQIGRADTRSTEGARRRGGKLTPNELISAILKAPVDLLYNGGIGTYVKSSRQTHAEVVTARTTRSA